MKPFNLAESKLVERSYCKKQIADYSRMIVAIACFATLVAIITCSCGQGIRGEASRVERELTGVKERCARSRARMDSAKSVQCESQWRSQLSGKSGGHLADLNAAIQCVPGSVWLDKVESAQGDVAVAVAGKTTSLEELLVYTGRLRQYKRFAEVRITDTQFGKAGTDDFLGFSLILQLRQAEGVDTASAAPGQASGGVPVLGGSR